MTTNRFQKNGLLGPIKIDTIILYHKIRLPSITLETAQPSVEPFSYYQIVHKCEGNGNSKSSRVDYRLPASSARRVACRSPLSKAHRYRNRIVILGQSRGVVLFQNERPGLSTRRRERQRDTKRNKIRRHPVA